MSKHAHKIVAPELLGKHLQLWPIGELNASQKHDLLRLRNDDAIRNNMYDNLPIPEDTHLLWCERVAKSETDHIYIVIREGNVLGQLAFRAIAWADRRCDWAFYLSQELKGKGVGKDLETIALRHVFETLGFNKLNCEVIAFNEPVIAMHLRFGFSLEGTRREHVFRDGKFHDVMLLGMTAHEYFENHQSAFERT